MTQKNNFQTLFENMSMKGFLLLVVLYQLVFMFQGLDFLDEGFTATFYQQFFNPDHTPNGIDSTQQQLTRNRYDGYNFKIFKHHVDDSTSINDDYINQVFQGPHHTLWIYTPGGWNIFDQHTEKFTSRIQKTLAKMAKTRCFI